MVCPACSRPWEACVCEDVLEADDWVQEEATCPDCSKAWERCGCDDFARLEDAYDNDPGPPSSRPASHSLPAPELDI